MTSVWTRFWSPASALMSTPAGAAAPEREAIRRRNDVWLKTYMDIYILRWGALWAACVVLAIVAASDGMPGLLLMIALAATAASFWGLVSMIRIYRRAAKAVEQSTP